MIESIAAVVEDKAWRAWDEAEEEGAWFTRVRFLQWGFAERFMVTAGNWLAF